MFVTMSAPTDESVTLNRYSSYNKIKPVYYVINTFVRAHILVKLNADCFKNNGWFFRNVSSIYRLYVR